MIVCTFNARGIGGRVKRRRIQQLIQVEKIDFMAIQETKLEVITEAVCFGYGVVRIAIGPSFLRKAIVEAYFQFGGR
jgi:hypothetical protein